MSFKHLSDRIRFFIHPLPLSAVILMAINDHWLKYNYPSVLTGKISDFCGVFYLPIFILAVIALFDFKKFRVNAKTTLAAIAFTDFLMILVKLSPAGAQAIEVFFNTYLFRIQIIPDPTDLIAFTMNPLTYLYLKTYWARSNET